MRQYIHTNTHTHMQSTKPSLQSGPLNVSLQNLEDFYMTDSISRASQTMARCVAAVKADKAKNTV